MHVAPSGRQCLIRYGTQQAVIVEVGAALRTYTVDGQNVLDGFAEDEICPGARGLPLIPWPNRTDAGKYEFDGVWRQLPVNDVADGHAVHGLTSWANWSVVEAGTSYVTLAYTLYPQPGWSWTTEILLTYRLGPLGLRITTTAVNHSPTRCPFGAGFHPYFRPPSGSVDKVVLGIPALSYDVTDERLIPIDRANVTATPWDFRQPRQIGKLAINVGYTDLQRDSDGVAVVTAMEPDTDWAVTVRLERGWDWIVVYTGDTLQTGPRQSLAIEPMTGPANLLRSGDHRITLEPNEVWEASWSIVPAWV